MLGYFARRAISRRRVGRRDGTYRRTVVVDGQPGVLEVSPGPDGDRRARCSSPTCPGSTASSTSCSARGASSTSTPTSAPPTTTSPPTPPSVRWSPPVPGLRVPGTWDPFETGVRAIVGQQVSVAGAGTITARLVERFGTPVDGLAAARAHPHLPDAGGRWRPPTSRASGSPAPGPRAINAFAAAVADGAVRPRRQRRARPPRRHHQRPAGPRPVDGALRGAAAGRARRLPGRRPRPAPRAALDRRPGPPGRALAAVALPRRRPPLDSETREACGRVARRRARGRTAPRAARPAAEPITEDDAAIRAALDDVDVVPLLVSVAQVTGDHSHPRRRTCAPTRRLACSPTPASPPSRWPRPATSPPPRWRAGATAAASARRPRPTTRSATLLDFISRRHPHRRLPPAAARGARPRRRGPAGAGVAQGRRRPRHRLHGRHRRRRHVGHRRRPPPAAGGRAVHDLEKNADVGGTWFENTYPGCRVDVPNHFYSYSFAQTPDWPQFFSTQDVLLDYFRACVDAPRAAPAHPLRHRGARRRAGTTTPRCGACARAPAGGPRSASSSSRRSSAPSAS